MSGAVGGSPSGSFPTWTLSKSRALDSPRCACVRPPPGEFRLFPSVQLGPSIPGARRAPTRCRRVRAVLHADASSSPTRFPPCIQFVPDPLPESLPFRGNSQSPVAREPADGARREGPGPEKSGNPTGRSPLLAAPRLSSIPSVSGARAVSPLQLRSRTRWLPQPRAWRAGFAPARVRALSSGWLAGAHAPERAPGRGEPLPRQGSR